MGTLGTKRRGLSSFLYHTSFSLFIVILAALLVGAAWGLGEQAARSSHASRWNLFALCVAFAGLVLISLILIWARIHGVSKALRAMPRPYVPTKAVDAPKAEELLLPGARLRRSDVARLVPAARALDPADAVLPTFVASYATLVQRAQYDPAEPAPRDAHAVQLVMPLIRNLVDIKRARAAAAAAAAAGSAAAAASAAAGSAPHAQRAAEGYV